MTPGPARVTVLGPQPIVTVTVEARLDGIGDEVHLHAGGQGVWVARVVGEFAAEPVLCSLVGGEVGAVLTTLVAALPGAPRLVPVSADSGCMVTDRRRGRREVMATSWPVAPSRHAVDDLFSATCATALDSQVLVVCNPFVAAALPMDFYGNLVADVRSNGTTVLVDLSSPRLDAALTGEPDIVKLNEWELAEYVHAPVSDPADRRAAVDQLRSQGARSVVVTRAAEPVYAVAADGTAFDIAPPRFERGTPDGCGDTMTGALAASLAAGHDWLDAVVVGAAAGAANFLRHGLGSAHADVVHQLVKQVRVSSASP